MSTFTMTVSVDKVILDLPDEALESIFVPVLLHSSIYNVVG